MQKNETKLQYKFKVKLVENSNSNMQSLNRVHEDQPGYIGFVHRSEDEKLRESIMRSPIEKLQLFTKMLRREYLLKKTKISHL